VAVDETTANAVKNNAGCFITILNNRSDNKTLLSVAQYVILSIFGLGWI